MLYPAMGPSNNSCLFPLQDLRSYMCNPATICTASLQGKTSCMCDKAPLFGLSVHASIAGHTAIDGTLDDTDEDWQKKRMLEAAAVLELLFTASLMLTPVDVDALKYICATAISIQVGNSKQNSLKFLACMLFITCNVSKARSVHTMR